MPQKQTEIPKATLVEDNLPGFTGHAAEYRLEPPISYTTKDGRRATSSYLVIAATDYLRDEPEPHPPCTEIAAMIDTGADHFWDWETLARKEYPYGARDHTEILAELGYML